MLSIDDASRPLPRTLLTAPGGFLWWYVDLVDEAGNGLVAIWSFGLPFLPGYTAAARVGRAPAAARKPSLNLCVYEGGKSSFYMLQEYSPEEVEWNEGSWRFGASRFVHKEGRDGQLVLHASLDAPIAGSGERLTGELRVEGRRVHGLDGSSAHGHLWTPLTTATKGTASLHFEGRTVRIAGRAYHDRNGSADHIDGLGIDDWLWGRFPMGDHELIYYLVEGRGGREAHVVDVGPDGRARLLDAEIVPGRERRAWFGMRWPRQMTLRIRPTDQTPARTLVLEQETLVDDGPFYLRFLVKNGDQVGIGERILPARVDRNRHRPLVKMAVHDTGGANSVWLPLFSGPRHTRLSRLLRQLR